MELKVSFSHDDYPSVNTFLLSEGNCVKAAKKILEAWFFTQKNQNSIITIWNESPLGKFGYTEEDSPSINIVAHIHRAIIKDSMIYFEQSSTEYDYLGEIIYQTDPISIFHFFKKIMVGVDKTLIKMEFDDWLEIFKPIEQDDTGNIYRSDVGLHGFTWTQVGCDNETSYIVEGFHYVNREGYIETTFPVIHGFTFEVNNNQTITTGKAKYLCIDFLEKIEAPEELWEDAIHDFFEEQTF